MSEQDQASVGQILHDAREAQGLTRENAAIRLRLMQRQIEAMEADDFAGLGQPVFARGFVRNYARLLGLAPEALLARMEGAPAEPATVSPLPPPSQRSWLTSPWLIVLLLGVLLAGAVPVALYWWLNSEVEEIDPGRAPAVQPRPTPTHAPAPILVPVPAPAPATELPVVEPTVSLPGAAPSEPVPASPDAPAAVRAEAGATAAPATVGKGVLHLEFGADSWTEIKDASGKMILRKLNVAGSSVDVQGVPPFALVIGNAAQAKLTYNGRPIDLKPFVDVTVARFTLEE
jgi:cytoskeleton protein RodZ